MERPHDKASQCNALAAAHDFKQAGGAVQILFQGAATRWIGKWAA